MTADTDGGGGPEPIREPLPNRLIRRTYSPAPISVLANFLVWGGSRIYRHRFGLGTNEWRVLSGLSNIPGLTGNGLSDLLSMNKATVSKSVGVLRERGLVVRVREHGARRLFLTEAGRRQHDEMLPIALERERILLEALDPGEVDAFRASLFKLVTALPRLEEYDDRMAGGSEAVIGYRITREDEA